MLCTKMAATYRIIKTKHTKIDLAGGEAIYSVLALYRDDDIVISRFAYDVARNEDSAKSLLERLKYIKPCENELCQTISELL